MLLGELSEGNVGIDAEDAGQRQNRLAHELAIAARPGRNRAAEQRLRLVGHDQPRVEVVRRTEPLTVGTGAVRRVERERPRRHLGHGNAAGDARQPTRKELIASVIRIDDDDLVGEVQRELERAGEPALDPRLDDQTIDHDVDRVVAPPVQLDVVVQGAELAVDARLREAALPQRLQLLLELALSSAHDGREHVDARVLWIEHHEVEDALERLRSDLPAAVVAVWNADVGEQQAQVVVDLGHRADGGARIRAGGLLLDGNGRRQTLDQVDIRLLHLFEKLPRVGRQRLDVAALTLGVDGVERQRRLAGAGQAGDHDQRITRQINVDVLEVVDAGAAYFYPIVRHTTCWEFRGCPKPPF